MRTTVPIICMTNVLSCQTKEKAFLLICRMATIRAAQPETIRRMVGMMSSLVRYPIIPATNAEMRRIKPSHRMIIRPFLEEGGVLGGGVDEDRECCVIIGIPFIYQELQHIQL